MIEGKEGNCALCDKQGKIKPKRNQKRNQNETTISFLIASMNTYNTHPELPSIDTVLCHWNDLTDGQAILRSGLIVLRSGEKVSAFINRCTHFGVPLALKESQLIFTPHEAITCNVHYARFRWEDGSCESGECLGEGLTPVFLQKKENGDICVLCY